MNCKVILQQLQYLLRVCKLKSVDVEQWGTFLNFRKVRFVKVDILYIRADRSLPQAINNRVSVRGKDKLSHEGHLTLRGNQGRLYR